MPPPRVAAGHYGIAVGGLPRLRERETRPNSLRSTNTLQNTQPQPEPPPPPSPATAIQVGYRAGSCLPPPPHRVQGVFWCRGPKSGQTLCREPQALVTSLISGRGLDFFSYWGRGTWWDLALGSWTTSSRCCAGRPPASASWGQAGTNPFFFFFFKKQFAPWALMVSEIRARAAGIFLGANL